MNTLLIILALFFVFVALFALLIGIWIVIEDMTNE
jgi:hypothetical protein